MRTKLAIASVLSASLFSMAACQATSPSPTNLPPGEYEKSTESVNKYGTKTATTTNTTVSKDAHGNKTAVVKQKTTKDPKGLFNKTTTTDTKAVIRD